MRPAPPLDDRAVRALLGRMALGPEGGEPAIEFDEQHSNSLARVRFPSGRTLVVKRARYEALAARFDTSSEASRLIHARTDLLAPRYLEVPDDAGEAPLLVYWWIPNPTLDDVWGDLDEPIRERALSECGRLLRRIHQVRLRGHGSLLDAEHGERPLASFLDDDLLGRLRPAVEGSWPAQAESVDRVREAFGEALSGREEPEPVLVHNDLFSANVLCARDESGVHCVGVIDFEDAFAGPVEADLAKTEVLHGPLFGRGFGGPWFRHVLQGYGGSPDPRMTALWRAYHLLNMGYHAAVTGLEGHAEEVGRVVERELDAWREGLSHGDVLA